MIKHFNSRGGYFLQVLFLFLPLSVITLYNEGPFYFYDTSGYYSVGEKALSHISWLTTEEADVSLNTPKWDQVAEYNMISETADLANTFYRSPVYGVFVFVLGGGMLVALTQVALMAVAIRTILYHLFQIHDLKIYLVIGVLLGGATSAGFVAASAMPDVFAAMIVLVVPVLVLAWPSISKGELAFLFALGVLASLTHGSHLLMIALAFLVISMLGLFARGVFKVKLRQVAVLAVFLVTGILTEFVAIEAAKRIHGREANRLPYLTARVMSDGPGRTFLAASCDSKGWMLCEVARDFEGTADDFLWSRDEDVGVLPYLSSENRKILAREELPFVFGAILHDPFGQAKATSYNVLRQLRMFGVEELSYNESMVGMLQQDSMSSSEHLLEQPLANAPDFLEGISIFQYCIVVLAGAYLIYSLFQKEPYLPRRKLPGMTGGLTTKQKRFVLMAVFLIMANGVVCGALSEPHDRYQARVIWVIVLLAIAVFHRARSLELLGEGAK